MLVHGNRFDPSSRPSPSSVVRSCIPLELAEHSVIANGLRMREATFNEDVLPRNFKPVAPRDLYAAIDLVPWRRREKARTQQGPEANGAMRLPDRAA